MKCRALALGFALGGCLLVPALGIAGQTPPDVALAFVQDHRLGESLGWLGFQVASRTVAFNALADSLGRTQAQTLVQAELQRLQPEFQVGWDRNLAESYAQSFSPEELKQINDGDTPPALANKFRAKQREVGMDMKARSSELLQAFVSRALDNVSKQSGKAP